MSGKTTEMTKDEKKAARAAEKAEKAAKEAKERVIKQAEIDSNPKTFEKTREKLTIAEQNYNRVLKNFMEDNSDIALRSDTDRAAFDFANASSAHARATLFAQPSKPSAETISNTERQATMGVWNKYKITIKEWAADLRKTANASVNDINKHILAYRAERIAATTNRIVLEHVKGSALDALREKMLARQTAINTAAAENAALKELKALEIFEPQIKETQEIKDKIEAAKIKYKETRTLNDAAKKLADFAIADYKMSQTIANIAQTAYETAKQEELLARELELKKLFNFYPDNLEVKMKLDTLRAQPAHSAVFQAMERAKVLENKAKEAREKSLPNADQLRQDADDALAKVNIEKMDNSLRQEAITQLKFQDVNESKQISKFEIILTEENEKMSRKNQENETQVRKAQAKLEEKIALAKEALITAVRIVGMPYDIETVTVDDLYNYTHQNFVLPGSHLEGQSVTLSNSANEKQREVLEAKKELETAKIENEETLRLRLTAANANKDFVNAYLKLAKIRLELAEYEKRDTTPEKQQLEKAEKMLEEAESIIREPKFKLELLDRGTTEVITDEEYYAIAAAQMVIKLYNDLRLTPDDLKLKKKTKDADDMARKAFKASVEPNINFSKQHELANARKLKAYSLAEQKDIELNIAINNATKDDPEAANNIARLIKAEIAASDAADVADEIAINARFFAEKKDALLDDDYKKAADAANQAYKDAVAATLSAMDSNCRAKREEADKADQYYANISLKEMKKLIMKQKERYMKYNYQPSGKSIKEEIDENIKTPPNFIVALNKKIEEGNSLSLTELKTLSKYNMVQKKLNEIYQKTVDWEKEWEQQWDMKQSAETGQIGGTRKNKKRTRKHTRKHNIKRGKKTRKHRSKRYK